MKNKMTKVKPNSLAESPNKAITKTKNKNNNNKKNKALKNVNGNIGALVSDSIVVAASDISKKGKKKKKKRKKKNKNLEHVNETTGGQQTDASMKDTSTENENVQNLNENIHTPMNDAETPVKDKEDMNDSPEISIKEIDKKVENSKNDIAETIVSTISKKKNKKKNKKQQQQKQQPVTEVEALTRDKEEINDNAETPMKDTEDIDEKGENSTIDTSLISMATISKKKRKRKKKNKKQPMTEVSMEDKSIVPEKDNVDCIDTPENKNIENLDEDKDTPMNDVSASETNIIPKKVVEDVKENVETPMKDNKDINESAETSVNGIEDTDEKAENIVIDNPVISISTISKKQKKKKQQPVADITPDDSVVTTDGIIEQSDVSTNNNKVDENPDVPSTKGEKKKNNKKKRKRPEMESTTTDVPCAVNGEISEAQSTATGSETETKKKKKKGEQNEEEERTVFVGNVCTKAKRKELALLFSKYGKVETVRIRGAAVADPKKSKKETVITGNYNSLRTTTNAYVRFKTKDMMIAALEANGVEFREKHLRVDRACSGGEHDTKHAVFIGNLPFEAEEEKLREHFTDCGEIESVRIIRDKNFASCIGIGYVNFKYPDSVEFALQLNNKLFMHRQLRVQRSVKKAKQKKKEKKNRKSPGKKGMGPMNAKNAKKARTEKNKPVADGDFSGMKMIETKKFKKMKKAKGKISKEDKKKIVVSRKLTGVKTKIKKT